MMSMAPAASSTAALGKKKDDGKKGKKDQVYDE